ncbi:MAG: hypothetical protein ACK5MT_19375 [Actinomycetales bacterium]
MARSHPGHSALADDLHRLCRGEGLRSPELPVRLTAVVLDACGASGEEDPGSLRDGVSTALLLASKRIPTENRLIATAALGLDPNHQHRFLKDRLNSVGVELDRSERTITRRLPAALTHLAEALLSDAPPATSPSDDLDSWYVGRLHSALLVDDDAARMFETRRIVATRDGLSGIEMAYSTPSPHGSGHTPLSVNLIYGGRLVVDPGGGHGWAGRLELPRPLLSGQAHEFGVEILVPHALQPYLIAAPIRRYDELTIRVKFRGAAPTRVWLVDGQRERSVDSEQAWDHAPELTLDEAGEVGATFTALRLGLNYGIGWVPGPRGPACPTE